MFEEAPSYLYFSASIEKLAGQFPELRSQLEPLAPFLVTEEGIQINLWLGRPGVVTYMHYDAAYNFFFQLRGRKRFRLLPPNAAMYPFPTLHPHTGQTQLNFRPATPAPIHARAADGASQADFPKFAEAVAAGQVEQVVAEVGPGEMLVLPPYWWHEVETLEPSVSLNTWTDAEAFIAMHDIYGVPLPLESEWAPPVLLGATRGFLDRLAALLQTEGRLVAAEVYEDRYRRLLAAGALAPDAAAERAVRAACRSAQQQQQQRGGDGVLVAPALAKIDERARALAARFAELTPPAVQRLSLGNYFEHVICTVAGPHGVAAFLDSCW